MLGKIPSKSLGIVLYASLLAACSPSYSPDTYSSKAAQQAAKVDQGVVVGIRAVQIAADTTLGATTGAAAGGIAGSQVGAGATSALSALGGTVAGGVVGSAVAEATGDAAGYEYIVRKINGDLVSVTQTDPRPLGIGAHVLIIEGPQARIVADYTVPITVEGLHPGDKPNAPSVAGGHPAGEVAAKPAAEAPGLKADGIVTAPLAPPAVAADTDKKPAQTDGAVLTAPASVTAAGETPMFPPPSSPAATPAPASPQAAQAPAKPAEGAQATGG